MRLEIQKIAITLMSLVTGFAHAGFVLETDPAAPPAKEHVEAAADNANWSVGTAPVATEVEAVVPLSRWDVKASDVTLRQSLIRWAKEAGWQVSWEVKIDYPVQLEASFVGTFETAVENYMTSLSGSDYPLMGCLYEGNRVVRVVRYGDNKGCDK